MREKKNKISIKKITQDHIYSFINFFFLLIKNLKLMTKTYKLIKKATVKMCVHRNRIKEVIFEIYLKYFCIVPIQSEIYFKN